MIKRPSYIVFLFLLSATIISCESTSYVAKGFKSSQVKAMDYIEPCCSIGLVDKGNKAVFSDSVTRITHNLSDSILWNERQFYRISNRIAIDGSSPDSIKSSIFKLVYQSTISDRRDTIKIDKCLQRFYQKSVNDYVLMMVMRGYTRSKANYSKKVAQSVGVGILTLGQAVPIWSKGGATVYMVVVDKRKNQIAYCNNWANKTANPVMKEDVKDEIDRLIALYLD